MPHQRILIVEDESDIADLIRFHVEHEGFTSEIAPTGRAAIEAVERAAPALIVLDLMLPDVGGLEICSRVRNAEKTRDVPVLILSAKGEDGDIVAGLELGADDYVVKPFSPQVLMARVRTLLRRRHNNKGTVSASSQNRIALFDEKLVIDTDRHEVIVENKTLSLTTTEFGILRYLAQSPGFVRTRDRILAAVRGDEVVLTRRTVDVHVTALRRKLGGLGSRIQTVRGVGYRFSDTFDDHDG